MFLQILYAVVKGLLEMDGYQLSALKAEPAEEKISGCPAENDPS